MKARITLTVHSLDALTSAQLADFIHDMIRRFGVPPSVENDTMVIHFHTDDHEQIFKLVEALQPELARRFSPDLWLSVGSEEVQA